MTNLTNNKLYGDNVSKFDELVGETFSRATTIYFGIELQVNDRTATDKEALKIAESLASGNAIVVPAAERQNFPNYYSRENFTPLSDSSDVTHNIRIVSDRLRKAAEVFNTIHFGFKSWDISHVVEPHDLSKVHFTNSKLGHGEIIYIDEARKLHNAFGLLAKKPQNGELLERIEALAENIGNVVPIYTPKNVSALQEITDIPSPYPRRISCTPGSQ